MDLIENYTSPDPFVVNIINIINNSRHLHTQFHSLVVTSLTTKMLTFPTQ